MAGLRRHRTGRETDVEVDMVPIMNMFLVLIPFLLISTNFINLKVINTSVPVLSDGGAEKKNEIKVTAIVEIKPQGLHISAASDAIDVGELKKWEAQIDKGSEEEYPFSQIAAHLKKIKERYPASDTLIIIPDESVIYDTVIQVMDVARYAGNNVPLFPSVVLSGKVG